MKTAKFYLAAVVLSVMFFSCQKNYVEPQVIPSDGTSLKASTPTGSETPGVSTTKNVTYLVNVNIDLEKPLCNTYYVKVVDANGNLVAPVQIYNIGTRTYTFSEQTRQTSGVRAALLVLSPNPSFSCDVELYTRPVGQNIEFVDASKYTFDLYPKAKAPKPIH